MKQLNREKLIKNICVEQAEGYTALAGGVINI